MIFSHHDYAVEVFNMSTKNQFCYSVYKKQADAEEAIKRLLDRPHPYVVWIEPHNYYDFS